jgi:hypothetical protein
MYLRHFFFVMIKNRLFKLLTKLLQAKKKIFEEHTIPQKATKLLSISNHTHGQVRKRRLINKCY